MKRKLLLLIVLSIFSFFQSFSANKTVVEGVDFVTDTMALGKFVQLTVNAPTDLVFTTDQAIVKNVEIKPTIRNIQYKVEGKKIHLIGVTPCKVAITVNEDYAHPIYLFVNPPHPKEWDNLPKNTICFKKGVHDIGKYLFKEDNFTLFLEDGAILKGDMLGEGVKNIKILGYGTIDGRVAKHGIRFNNSENIEINGPLVLSRNGWSTSFFQCKNLQIKNCKILSSEVYSDGIDLLATSDVLVDDVFIRNEDDCITLKTKKYIYSRNTERVTIQNSVFWSGKQGNALEIGWELDGQYVKDIRFENNDIIRKETNPKGKYKRAAISIHHVGNSTITNVLYKDIRIESVFENLIWLELIPANKWGSGGGTIDGVHFENITYLNGEVAPIVIKGGPTGMIKNIEFNGLKYKGKAIQSISDPLFQIESAEVVVK